MTFHWVSSVNHSKNVWSLIFAQKKQTNKINSDVVKTTRFTLSLCNSRLSWITAPFQLLLFYKHIYKDSLLLNKNSHRCIYIISQLPIRGWWGNGTIWGIDVSFWPVSTWKNTIVFIINSVFEFICCGNLLNTQY